MTGVPMHVCWVAQSRLTLCDPMDYDLQWPLSMGFSRHEYWSGSPCSPPGHLPDPNNHNGVITHLESNILECEVKWALRSITMNKASGGDGIPVELFQTLKDNAVKMMHSICQQIWKAQQWPQDWKKSTFIPIPKKGNAKECSKLPHNCFHLPH